MCDIALVYSQWLCFYFLRWTDISGGQLNDWTGLFTEDQSAVEEEQNQVDVHEKQAVWWKNMPRSQQFTPKRRHSVHEFPSK